MLAMASPDRGTEVKGFIRSLRGQQADMKAMLMDLKKKSDYDSRQRAMVLATELSRVEANIERLQSVAKRFEDR